MNTMCRRVTRSPWRSLGFIGIVCGLLLVLAPSAATPTEGPAPEPGEVVVGELAAPIFTPMAAVPGLAGSCGGPQPASVALATASDCHSFSKKVDDECCATMEDTVCCGTWCHDDRFMQ